MSWGHEAQNPSPDWTMSVSLETVRRGDEQLAEVTSLREAVGVWLRLDRSAQDAAVLRSEHPITVDGVQHERFEGQGIAALAERLDD